jgi:hypothetical protein
MSSCADFFFMCCPKAWSASATSASSPTAEGKPPLHVAASCLARRPAQSAPKQRICRVAPPVQEPCWSSNGSPVLNFTSSLTCASPPHGDASLTAHKTSMIHDESIPVARRHGRARKATLCQKAAHAPYLRHRLTPCGTQFHSQTGLPLLQRSRSASEMPQMSHSATLKIHR